MKVIVFGATGAQGRAQVLELLRQGHEVRAVSRNPQAFAETDFAGVERVAADYDDISSLERALRGVDALFFQAPALGDNARLLKQCERLVKAAGAAGLQRVVVNSSMWAPDEPCGERVYDGVLAMEQVFKRGEMPLMVFRPTLYMNNLLGDWIRPVIVAEGVYRYAHKPNMKADWICLEDVAKFMVAALHRPDLIGRKIRIGGPERLTTLQMLEVLSEVIGRPIRHEYITPRDFGEMFWSFYGATSGLDRATYVAGWESFYTFNNDAPQRPFEADVKAALDLIPVQLTTLKAWASAQQWCV